LLSETHKKNYRDAIELGALTIISEFDPEKASELRIQKYQMLLEEEQQKLANYRLIKQLKKPEPKKQNKTTSDSTIEKMRLDKFSANKLTIAKQVQKGNADWKKFAEVYFFDSPNEARKWTMAQLQEAELLG
jgi:hypothetical protein